MDRGHRLRGWGDRRALAARAGRAAEAALAALLPCPACGVRPAGPEGWCAACRERGLRPGHDAASAWLGDYAGPLGRAVRALKYRGATRLGGTLGRELATQVTALGWRPAAVCAVPLHPSRQRGRGYDQAALLARGAAARLHAPYRPLLRRTRPTRPQTQLRRGERQANVAGAFASQPAHGLPLLLVDDVLTTGATTGACVEALLAAGARQVWVAVAARADRPAAAPRTGADASVVELRG